MRSFEVDMSRDAVPFPCKTCLENIDKVIEQGMDLTRFAQMLLPAHMRTLHAKTWMTGQDKIKEFMEQRRNVLIEFNENLRKASR